MRAPARLPLLLLLALLAGCAGRGTAPDPAGGTAVVPPPGRAATDPARRTAVDTALAQLGVRYRYGGNHPGEGFDCSGLVKYAFDAAGIRLPRVSRDQLAATAPVPLDDAEPGDLVFFQGENYSHVGIYLGDGRFVHAPQSGRAVEIGSFGNDWYRQRFVRAGRVKNW